MIDKMIPRGAIRWFMISIGHKLIPIGKPRTAYSPVVIHKLGPI